jgi:hypothetical protein
LRSSNNRSGRDCTSFSLLSGSKQPRDITLTRNN